MIMHQEIEYGIRPITIDTGTDVVTPENVDEYNPGVSLGGRGEGLGDRPMQVRGEAHEG